MRFKRIVVRRRFLILTGLVAAVAFGLGTVLSQTLPKLKSWMMVTIDTMSGEHLPVRILPGSVEFRLVPLGITLHDVRVLPTESFAAILAPLKIEEASANLSLLQIIQGRVALSKVAIRGTAVKVTVPATPDSNDKPLAGLFRALDKVPIDSAVLENVSAVVEIPKHHLRLEFDQVNAESTRARNHLAIELAADSVLVVDTAKKTSIRLSPELDIELEPNSLEVNKLIVHRGTSMLSTEGTLSGDTEALQFQEGQLDIEADIDAKTTRDWVQKSIAGAEPTPPMDGRIKLKAKATKASDTPWRSDFELETADYRVEGILVDKVKLKGNWDGKSLHVPEGTIDSRAGHFDLTDGRIGPGQAVTAQTTEGTTPKTPWILRVGKLAGKAELHEFMEDIHGVGAIPVWLTLSGEGPCESQLYPNFQFRCGVKLHGENAVVQGDLKNGRVAAKSIAAIPVFDIAGDIHFDLDKFSYTADVAMPDSKGRSSGEVYYKTGFDIQYEADRLAIKDLASLGSLKLAGVFKMKGSTKGSSAGATFTMNAEGENLWLEDFWLGQPKAEVSYKSGMLYFNGVQGYYSTSRYSGEIAVNLQKATIDTQLRVPFFDARDLLRIFSRKFTFPVALSGTGQATIKASGPIDLSKLTYNLKSSLFKGTIAGESFDQIHFDVNSNAGEVKSERVSFTKGESVITLAGEGHPDGTIKANVRGHGLRIENTNLISESGFALAGVVDFDMLLAGPVLAPDADMTGTLTKTTIAETPMPDSSFKLQFKAKTIEGSGALLGDVVGGTFVWPLTPDAPLLMQFESREWNFAPLFAAIAGPQGRRDFEGKLSAKVNLKAAKGGFWAASGGVDISKLSLKRGTIELSNGEKSAHIDAKDGTYSIRDFELGGEGTFVKINDRPGADPNVKKLDVQINAKIDMNLLSIFTPFFEELRGLLNMAVSLKLTPNGSDVIGSAYIDRGFIKFPAFPHPFENIQSDLVFNHQKIVVNTIRSDFASGRITASGGIDLKGRKNVPVNMIGTFDKVTLNVPDKMRTSGSGDFTFTGSWFPFLLKGNYNVRDGLITKEIDDGAGGDTNVRREQFLPKFLIDEAFVPLLVDMKIDFPGGVQVRNEHIEGSAAGRIQVSGNPVKPKIEGQIRTLPETKLKFRENLFEVNSAVLTFEDPNEINPKINVNARARVDEYDVTLLVQGTGKKPEFVLSSVPPLPEKELFSLLALGVTDKTLAGRTSSQQQSNATSQQVLSTVANPLVKSVAKELNVETQISTGFDETGEANSKIVLKKQFNKKLEVQGSRSLGKKNETSAKVRLRLTDRVSAVGSWQQIDRSETSSDSSSQQQGSPDKFGFDFEYKFEFK